MECEGAGFDKRVVCACERGGVCVEGIAEMNWVVEEEALVNRADE